MKSVDILANVDHGTNFSQEYLQTGEQSEQKTQNHHNFSKKNTIRFFFFGFREPLECETPSGLNVGFPIG